MEVKKDFSDKAKYDFKLVERARNEDQKAYAELLKRYRRPLYHLVLKMVRNQEDAEDLTIESFSKAFRNLAKFNADFTFSTWLFRIATNNCIDFLRRKKLSTTSIDNSFLDDGGDDMRMEIRDKDLNPQEVAIREQKIELVRIIVNKLPKKYKLLVGLRYFEELSYEEIATETGAPLGTVKAQLHRARELLYDLVKDKKEMM
ncbi:MAG TPA: RNA polymerase subunit sigma-24 [Cytophagales bacterium]|nr:RNA polymerase subunit sigma-24 [Cytophagales bacterium]